MIGTHMVSPAKCASSLSVRCKVALGAVGEHPLTVPLRRKDAKPWMRIFSRPVRGRRNCVSTHLWDRHKPSNWDRHKRPLSLVQLGDDGHCPICRNGAKVSRGLGALRLALASPFGRTGSSVLVIAALQHGQVAQVLGILLVLLVVVNVHALLGLDSCLYITYITQLVHVTYTTVYTRIHL